MIGLRGQESDVFLTRTFRLRINPRRYLTFPNASAIVYVSKQIYEIIEGRKK